MSQKQVMPKSEDLSRSLEINEIWTFDTEFPTIFNKSCTYIYKGLQVVEDGEEIQWTNIRQLQVTKDASSSFFFRLSHHYIHWLEIYILLILAVHFHKPVAIKLLVSGLLTWLLYYVRLFLHR